MFGEGRKGGREDKKRERGGPEVSPEGCTTEKLVVFFSVCGRSRLLL